MSKSDHLASDVLPVAQDLVELLRPHCSRIEIAGSLRRKKPYVGDIELLFIPKLSDVPDMGDLFGATKKVSAAAWAIEDLIAGGIIGKRKNELGRETWGAQNMLAVHIETRIPVDFFSTTEDNWFNALVVRTGPTTLNKRIAQSAIDMGWSWHAYGNGFTRNDGMNPIDQHRVTSELDLFQFVGIPFLIPEDR